MKVDVLVRQEIEASFVSMVIPVRYDDEDMPNDFPGRTKDEWYVWVCLDNGDLWLDGKTLFPADASLDLHMKVVDGGLYQLRDREGVGIGDERSDYVPGFFPGSHYGDYIIFEIEGGRIKNWKAPTAEQVASAFRLNVE